MAKCLVADDSKIIRMLFAKIMGNLGFDVTEAEDGEEVVEQCQLNEFDLVIMDYRLPCSTVLMPCIKSAIPGLRNSLK